MPLQATSGAASYDAIGGGAAYVPTYIEDVFSTWLYTGTGATQTITNGIDLSTKGGLVWIKGRSGATDNALYDTARGATFDLVSNSSAAQTTQATGLTAFGSTGFSIGALAKLNTSAATYASWTFREQAKFFDVVTYTGTGVASRAISHNLGSAPGMMIVKRTDSAQNWPVYHRSVPTGTAYLNTTGAFFTGAGNGVWGDAAYNNIAPTSTVFYVGSDSEVNANGATYVAYLFAHDAGGFGLTGSDNVISCGASTAGNPNGQINLGYEPQWILFKASTSASAWYIVDNMRCLTDGLSTVTSLRLSPNTAGAEGTFNNVRINATGFQQVGLGVDYIYIAIRRGPMKVPTSGTSVFSPLLTSATNGATNTTGFPVDLQMFGNRSSSSLNFVTSDRLRGVSSNSTEFSNYLVTSTTAAETTANNVTEGWNNTGFVTPSVLAGVSYLSFNFGRAPSFFDIVCYTGTGVARTVTHNLAAVPELMIVKDRTSGVYDWRAYSVTIGNTNYLTPNAATLSGASSTTWNNTTPTASVFTVGTSAVVNGSGDNYVAYLFATCAGVSKVGSYTGNGTTQTIDCGFGAGGARFVLIKRTDASSGWYIYDTARGMTVLTDPYIFLNDGSAEVATLGSVTTVSTGFALNSAILAAINVNAGTYIFLAIA